MKKSSESWEGYLYRLQQPGTYARLYGIEPFDELFSKGIIVPFVTAIRIMYSGAVDVIYLVNEKGEMLDVLKNDVFSIECESIKPMELLSKEKSPHGWEVEGIKPQGYDERRKT